LDYFRFRVFQGFHFTGAHAFRIAPTEGTFKGLPPVFGETHGPEGAGHNAHLAAHALVVIDHDPVQLGIAGDGLGGAGHQTRWVFTLIAGRGQKKNALTAGVFDNPDTCPTRIFYSGVL
jgi:hypothetical protein